MRAVKMFYFIELLQLNC